MKKNETCCDKCERHGSCRAMRNSDNSCDYFQEKMHEEDEKMTSIDVEEWPVAVVIFSEDDPHSIIHGVLYRERVLMTLPL